jgi:hypothetical protein
MSKSRNWHEKKFHAVELIKQFDEYGTHRRPAEDPDLTDSYMK